jgi:Transglycosylase SLT domain
MHLWILSLMLGLQPRAPWLASYEDTAKAIATVVTAEVPLFTGERGREKTAALMVALAWAESRFNPGAVGDHGLSVGLYQMSSANLPSPEGYRRADLLGHPIASSEVALHMLRQSFAVCAARPLNERVAWYASGDSYCQRGQSESRYRMGLAMRAFTKYPPPATYAAAPTAAVPTATAAATASGAATQAVQ